MNELVDQQLSPKWPTLDDIDVGRIAFVYDRDSDILLARFDDRALRAVVHYVGDFVALLVDLETEDVVGLQVEDYLTRAAVDDPGLLTLLDLAELRGGNPRGSGFVARIADARSAEAGGRCCLARRPRAANGLISFPAGAAYPLRLSGPLAIGPITSG